MQSALQSPDIIPIFFVRSQIAIADFDDSHLGLLMREKLGESKKCPLGRGSGVNSLMKLNLGPILTYLDIFESKTFSFQIQKFPHQLVVYSIRIRLSTRVR